MSWRRTYPLRFADCDSGGIAYYPRLFELTDAAIEDWSAETIADRRTRHEQMRLGLPTVTLEDEFTAPAHLGDLLEMTLTVTALVPARSTSLSPFRRESRSSPPVTGRCS